MSAMNDRAGLLSMTRRVALTVLSAFAAVFLVLFTWLWWQTLARDTGEVERGLLRSARAMVAALDEVDDEQAARVLLANVRHLQAGAELADEPPIFMTLARLDGSATLRLGPLGGLDLARVPEGASTQELDGMPRRMYVASGQRWKVVLVDDVPERSRWYGWTLFTDLATYLGMALPLVLLPVWWMARATLKPLRRLSDTVAARSPLDTSPLPEAGRWKELAPLERALNQLFHRTAQGLAREKAFVHDAAHELRTPLAVIAAQNHVLASSTGAAREAAQRQMDAAVTRASHLTQQLLHLARADAAAGLPREPVDLMNLVRDAMALHAARAAAQGTELDLQGPDQLPMASDPRALRSIVDNLLDNALRYGGPGGCVSVGVVLTHGTLLFSVADQGPGIPPAHRERVFERFWRGAGHSQPGSGLGLAIVREAAHSLGGDAEVADTPAGTTVRVSLPAP